MSIIGSFLSLLLALLLVPLFPGIILKVKAFFAGKKGPPLLIKYYTLLKLAQKGSVYSTSSTFVFLLGPLISCAAALMALLFFPFAWMRPLFSFQGDIIALLYFFGLARFFTIAAALDTASPFEGMGAAREAFFAFLAEATLFAVLILFFRMNGALSLGGYFAGQGPLAFDGSREALLVLVVAGLFMVMLAENSRVPVDDPATHLELTMIHEAMILDHSGPDLALIEFGAFCKLFFYAAFVACLLKPARMALNPLWATLLFYGLVTVVYAAIGLVESVTARLKMPLVPKYLLSSFALVFFAIILTSLEFIP